VLAGVGAIVLVAGGAAAAYVVMFHSPAPAPATHLSASVTSTDTVGLAAFATGPGTKPGQLVQLLAPQGALGFFGVSAAENAAGQPRWTADQMSGGTFVFIYLSTTTGECLSAAGSAARPVLAVRHCDVTAAQQRWRRLPTSVVEAQHAFYEFANLADGKCISQTGPAGQPGSDGLASCDRAFHPASQLLAFWWTTQ
jgi:hypothetical protein